jgi:hypothetical protein
LGIDSQIRKLAVVPQRKLERGKDVAVLVRLGDAAFISAAYKNKRPDEDISVLVFG